MTEAKIDRAELKKRAAEIGLTGLTDKHLEQLERATAGARQRKSQLPDDLHFSDEPAHIYRANGEA